MSSGIYRFLLSINHVLFPNDILETFLLSASIEIQSLTIASIYKPPRVDFQASVNTFQYILLSSNTPSPGLTEEMFERSKPIFHFLRKNYQVLIITITSVTLI